jgi:hypothetical protein
MMTLMIVAQKTSPCGIAPSVESTGRIVAAYVVVHVLSLTESAAEHGVPRRNYIEQ